MRKPIKAFLPLPAFIFLLLFTACTKEDTPSVPHSMSLYNVPLVSVQSYLAGEWEAVYSKGGVAGGMAISSHPAGRWLWKISVDGIRIRETYNGYVTDTTLSWQRVRSSLGDTINLMKVPNAARYSIDALKNDTLVVSDYQVPDGRTHFWIRKH